MNVKDQLLDELAELYAELENSENMELSEVEELLYQINVIEQTLEN